MPVGSLVCRPYRLSLPGFEIGPYTYYASDLELRTYAPTERIIIGSYCSIADQVLITTGGLHRTDVASTYPFDIPRCYQGTANTVIGSDVWIGTRATVRGGVNIGHGAVVGSGAVVFSNVPDYGIVAGNPAEVIRYRFSKSVVDRLLRIAWWDWPVVRIVANREWFYRPIEEFVDRFDPVGRRA